jgi:Co/Zn/Cd efflux system component
MMVIEIFAGYLFGSMALLADGWHMGTHAAALGITAFAYTITPAENPMIQTTPSAQERLACWVVLQVPFY